jgi:histone-lysine N-methyltransferase SETD3
MLCKCCNSDKNKAFFSKSQLKKNTEDRKCIDCCELSSSKFTLENQQTLFSNLVKWLHQNGAEFPYLKIKHFNENFRGIVTNKNVYRGNVVLKVPHQCIMTSLKAHSSTVGKELENSKWRPHSSHTWLALFLLQEKMDPNSFWKPYIDILPPTYGDFPQFYSSGELKQLKGSFILDMIKSRNLNLEKEFNELVQAIPIFGKKITLRDYIWARIAVVSRVFQINLGNKEKTEGLVPMADMLNHEKTPGTKWSFIPNEDAFIIASDSFLFKNKEVFDTYGPKCNSRYLVNYGFTLKDNQENNQAAIFINPEKILDDIKCPFKERKMRMISNNHTTIDDSYCEYRFLINEGQEALVSKEKHFRFQFMTLLDEEVSDEKGIFTGLHSAWCLFGFLRFLLSNEEEFMNITYKINEKMKSSVKVDFTTVLLDIKPPGVETELSVLKRISEHCERILDGFPSLVEEDEKEIESVEPYTNRWNILNMLIGEKKVLLFYRELGVFVNKLWNESKSAHKVGRFLRKHKLFSTYYKVYWSQLL